MVKWCKIVKNPWLQGLLHKLLTCGAASLAAWAARLEALPTWRFVAMKWSCLNTRKEAIKTHTCLYIYIHTFLWTFKFLFSSDIYGWQPSYDVNASIHKLASKSSLSGGSFVKGVGLSHNIHDSEVPQNDTLRPRKTLGILRRSLDRWTTSLKDINL